MTKREALRSLQKNVHECKYDIRHARKSLWVWRKGQIKILFSRSEHSQLNDMIKECNAKLKKKMGFNRVAVFPVRCSCCHRLMIFEKYLRDEVYHGQVDKTWKENICIDCARYYGTE